MSAFFARLFERITNRQRVRDLKTTISHRDELLDLKRETISMQNRALHQIQFLLDQAPMQNAPANLMLAAHAVTKYAYVHPNTYCKFTNWRFGALDRTRGVELQSRLISPSPTQWILTSLMPEGRVIFTPNEIPGFVVKS